MRRNMAVAGTKGTRGPNGVRERHEGRANMDLNDVLIGEDNVVPRARYTSPEFAALEFDRLWSRVWQVACREEEIADVGDFSEYLIGDQSILVVRSGPDTVRAFHNTCLHRGTRLADGAGRFPERCIRCRYHAWRYDLDGKLVEVVDREEFGAIPEDAGLHAVRVDRGAASSGSA